ncbi:UBR1 [Cordylochernes scorpioides]|uniref:E3 ubiquitin-protein ligase n=1 Tax=Cordylochernes scorpioides TaxID=51811 RepID=A0ABY6LX78_9ARAC|nr:UBR1 [Cordylochernes scorpioides]
MFFLVSIRNIGTRISMSSGGGYCDCGDEGAWKCDAYCSKHYEAKEKASEKGDPLQRIPKDMADRAKFVLEVALNYTHEMLTWEHSINLPPTLGSSTLETDKFTTTLYNDESHTYDQVISTLSRALNVTQNVAVTIATQIDREGRSTVLCATHASCKQLARDIEKLTARHGSRPLKVLLIHSDILAHQNFAMRLLSWIRNFLAYSEAFRVIFSDIMVKPDFQTCLLQSVMLNDVQLWKSARNQWHQLFISSMHMDQECKKLFAKIFLRNYPTIMKDFIADDHEHSVSITCLSVQIFTMPLAHTLVEEDDALNILLRTFLSECEPNRNETGKLAFERNHFNATLSFKRASYILYDIKYLLTVKPKEWSEKLRKHFINGLQSLLQLLVWMQGMDSVVRQMGQHVEFEAEWETGVNLQLKLASVITLAIEWCGADYTVLIRALRLALRKLEGIQGNLNYLNIEFANHSASCIDYNVAYLPVTIHIPLSRFVAGLLLQLGKYNAKYDKTTFALEHIPSPVQLMEYPLRTLVLIAQFRAGMWRRNGYSLLNQVFFYSNVKLRDEMFDRDIQMLQIAASLMNSDDFLIHLLNKYGLVQWAQKIESSTDNTKKSEERERENEILTIAEEFLLCILYVVSERYVPGLGKVDSTGKIKKEILQLLCIEPMPPSQIFKQLPKDPNHETGMEAVINEVGNFRQISCTSKGKYELKSELYKEFNPYYYHYTREEQSKAGEAQIKRKRSNREEECCPPPVPVEFCAYFENITNILQCDVFLQLIKVVMQKTLNTTNSENLLEKTLFLIGLALHEDVRNLMKDNSSFNFIEKANEKNILQDLQDCLTCQKVEAQKDLITWTIKKYKSVESMKKEKLGESSEIPMDFNLVLPDPKKDRKKNAALAAARRERIMAQMTNMQKSFIEGNADLFKAVDAPAKKFPQTSSEAKEVEDPIAVGINQRGKKCINSRYTCILCREEQDVHTTDPTMVLAAFVQRSSVLSKARNRPADNLQYDPLLMPSDLFTGPHISTCGHVMHSKCWQNFFESVLNKERRRPLRYGRHVSFNIENKEFLCPLCERLSNSAIPLVPPFSGAPRLSQCPVPFDDFLIVLLKVIEIAEKEKYLPHFDLRVPSIAKIIPEVQSGEHLRSVFMPTGPFIEEMPYHESLKVMMSNFGKLILQVGYERTSVIEDPLAPIMIWNSISFTIHVMEWLLRDKPIFQELSSRDSHCLQAIIRYGSSSLRIFDKMTVQHHAMRLVQYLMMPQVNYANNNCLYIPAPEKLQLHSTEKEEYVTLCQYLGLPLNLSELLTTTMRQVALRWVGHPSIPIMLSPNDDSEGIQPLIRQPLEVNQLITLPKDYSELINSVSDFSCDKSNDKVESRYPTICLVCGSILCSQSYCCQTIMPNDGTLYGACTLHAQVCGAGVGLFLRIRDCKLLLLAGKTKGE